MSNCADVASTGVILRSVATKNLVRGQQGALTYQERDPSLRSG